tara:strand:+ start:143 stop:616 length:474 start_codon:yes stop_codon:yes gene_type:complete
MNKFIYTLLIPFLTIQSIALAHCQVPCGIYDDALRIIQIKEDFKTIRKAMDKISQLSEKSDPLSNNQLNRWVITKEQHATNIQKIVSEYFLTQRIKTDKSQKYIDQTTTLHQALVAAMKCKQTIDDSNVNHGVELVNTFVEYYFDDHGLEHIIKLSE